MGRKTTILLLHLSTVKFNVGCRLQGRTSRACLWWKGTLASEALPLVRLEWTLALLMWARREKEKVCARY